MPRGHILNLSFQSLQPDREPDRMINVIKKVDRLVSRSRLVTLSRCASYATIEYGWIAQSKFLRDMLQNHSELSHYHKRYLMDHNNPQSIR